jgi:hypothetical protein
MAQYYLAHHVSWCRTEDGVVLLDLRRGRYLGLDHQGASLIDSITASSAAPMSDSDGCPADQPALIKHLLSAGLLTSQAACGTTAQPAIEPAQTAAFNVATKVAPHIRAHHVVNFLRALVTARLAVKRWSLERMVHRARARRATGDTGVAQTTVVLELTTVYHYLRACAFTAKEACLFDSLVLLEFLGRYQLFPRWIFGIKTQPFGAHSWLQYGTIALNDAAEHTRLFVPILVI